MANTSKTVVFFGTDNFSLTILRGLVESGYDVTAVVTKPDSKSGRGHKLNFPDTKRFAIEHNIKILQPKNVSEINEDIKILGDNVVGVLASYGKIIPQSTIGLFNPGIINVHPSLLPKYRGPSPIESVIQNGDEKTGISIMRLTPDMDAGQIYGQMTYILSGNENRIDLRKKLSESGAEILLSLLPGILNGKIKPKNQNENDATYCKLLAKNQARLDVKEMTAAAADRKIRTFRGLFNTKLDVLGHSISVTKAHVTNESKTPLDIKFKDGNYLSIDELIAPSGRTMPPKEFLNGYIN